MSWIAKRGVQRGVVSEEKSGLGSPTVCFVSQDRGEIFGSRNLPTIPAPTNYHKAAWRW